jgi:uncharacterized protein YuzE
VRDDHAARGNRIGLGEAPFHAKEGHAAIRRSSPNETRVFSAYLRLEESPAQVKRTKEAAPSLLVDFDGGGRVLGLEILAFDATTVARINEVLVSVGHAALSEQELAPLCTA